MNLFQRLFPSTKKQIIPKDILNKVDSLFKDEIERKEVKKIIGGLWKIRLNVGAGQLARSILVLADGKLGEVRKIASDFMGDPRDVINAAERKIGNPGLYFIADLVGWEVESETYEEVSKRYIGFGANLFSVLQNHIPDLFIHLKFFRSTTFQRKDVLAIFENGKCSFGIQLCLESEVICLWNEEKHFEIGTWSANEIEEAIENIKKEFLVL